MNWTDLRSHTDQVAMLRRCIQRGRLTHAWLFAGPAGVGKSRFARILAQCLLCDSFREDELNACGTCSNCRQMDAGSHPDFFHIQRPEDKSEIPVEVFIGPPERRGREGLIHDLSLRPMAGRRRIALLDDANRMNDEGANAMLKTLEEPPRDSLLILIAENPDAILPTIRSRCQLIRFAPLPRADVEELLLSTSMTNDPAEAAAVADVSEGSLQTAAQLLNPGIRDMRLKLFELLSAPALNSLEVARAATATLDELGGEAANQRRNLAWLIRFAAGFYRQVVLQLSGSERQASADDPAALLARRFAGSGIAGIELASDLFDRCVLAENQVEWNIAPTRVLEALFEDLGRLTRQRTARN